MKKFLKAVSATLVLILIVQSAFVVSASSTTYCKFTGKTYTHQTRFDNCEKFVGIDVSEHNGSSVDFNKMKARGIDFVFVRVGYTGYTKSRHAMIYDSYYQSNINKALAAGMAVGVYWYSQALNEQEALAEADKLTSVLDNYNITLGVVMDYEFAGVSEGRLDSAWANKTINKDIMTANAMSFLDRVNTKGYDACFYANKSFLSNCVDGAMIDDFYKVWLAHYTTNTDYTGDYEYWQYSSSGMIDGAAVDMNYWYVNSSDDLQLGNYNYTGEEIMPSPVITDNDKILVENEDYVLSYSNNIDIGTGNVTATGINDYNGKSWNYSFNIVLGRVDGVTVNGRSTASISLSWDEVLGASSYYIYVENLSKGTAFSKTVSALSTSLNNLTPSNYYRISVRAMGFSSVSEFSVPIGLRTAPPAVSNFRELSNMGGSVKLAWDKLYAVQGYRIYKINPENGGHSLIADISDADVTEYTISGLSKVGVYDYYICAYVKDVYGMQTGSKASISVAIKENAVNLVSVESLKHSKVKVLWDKTNAQQYQLEWSTTSDFSSNCNTVTVSRSVNTYTIKRLQSNTQYYVRIRACNKLNGRMRYGSWSDVKSTVAE